MGDENENVAAKRLRLIAAINEATANAEIEQKKITKLDAENEVARHSLRVAPRDLLGGTRAVVQGRDGGVERSSEAAAVRGSLNMAMRAQLVIACVMLLAMAVGAFAAWPRERPGPRALRHDGRRRHRGALGCSSALDRLGCLRNAP